MRVIKQNTLTYETFHKSLPYLTKSTGPGGTQRFINSEFIPEEEKSIVTKLNYMLQFRENVAKAKTNDQIFGLFENLTRDILNVCELNVFVFGSNRKLYTPFYPQASERMASFVNKQLRSGTLKEIMTSSAPKLVPDSIVYNIDGSRQSYLFIPFADESLTIDGFPALNTLLVISLASQYRESSPEVYLVRLSLKTIIDQISLNNRQKALINKISELQTYQAKLANDFKLSAIGELTSGIVEEILSPLQVISTTTELLRSDNNQADGEILDTINMQVKKVKRIINSLIKFAGNNESKSSVQPCNINDLINEFYMLTVSSLNNDSYECITDLEENLPQVITQPNYIYQLLTNVFSIIRSKKGSGGGILIQSRYRDDKVEIKFLTTDYEENLRSDKVKENKDMNLKMIKNIMASHEGGLFIDSDRTTGTLIRLSFPIKRNLGK